MFLVRRHPRVDQGEGVGELSHLLADPFAVGAQQFQAIGLVIRTPLQRHLSKAEMTDAGWLDDAGEPVPGLFRTPDQGAATPLWAATKATRGGAYCADCRDTESYSHDDAEAARLWLYSTEVTGRGLPQRG